MRTILLTWYGITDLRASLSQDDILGPVLSALLASEYTDVIVLGYTDVNKRCSKAGFNNEYRALNQKKLSQHNFISTYANSLEAHEHFINWLSQQLVNKNKSTSIDFRSIQLSYLNDTQGIYDASLNVMDYVANLKADVRVTLYLSPGTPVMAFVWAFTALRFPHIKKRLIASSKPDKPPEDIQLPIDWLEWHGKRLKVAQANFQQYDVIFHLFGEQKMPTFLGIRQFECNRHVFITSPRFPADSMSHFIGGKKCIEINVDPYNPEDVRAKIVSYIDTLPDISRMGFNLTGGTKLMYAGALAACRKVNATPFYFNDYTHQVIYLNDFHTEDIKLINEIEPYIGLNASDLIISSSGYWNDIIGIYDTEREALTKLLWLNRKIIVYLYGYLCGGNYNSEPGKDFTCEDKYKNIKVSLEQGAKATAVIRTNNGYRTFKFDDWADFAKYLCGGWFEEYSYLQLKPLMDNGTIKDMRIGYMVGLNIESSKNIYPFKESQTYQELDIVLTDGRRLYIIECKSGNTITGEYVNKLESITRYFGGQSAKGILLASKDNIHPVVQRKAEESHNVTLYNGKDLFEGLTAYFYNEGQ